MQMEALSEGKEGGGRGRAFKEESECLLEASACLRGFLLKVGRGTFPGPGIP